QKGQQLDGGIQTGEESTGVEGDQARNGSVGAWSGVGIARSCGALTPVALRAPSVSAPQDLLTLLRRGTSYFALTPVPLNRVWDYRFQVKTQGVLLTDALVVTLFSKEGKKFAQLTWRQ